jgi:hypothetical protein
MRLSENKVRRIAERIVDELEQQQVLSYTQQGPAFRSQRIKAVYELIMADMAAEAEIDQEVDRVLTTYSRTLRANERDILYRKHKEEIARRRNFEL